MSSHSPLSQASPRLRSPQTGMPARGLSLTDGKDGVDGPLSLGGQETPPELPPPPQSLVRMEPRDPA